MRKILPVLVLLLLLSGCSEKSEVEGGFVKIVDMAGRTVEVPEKVERVVAIGPGALRFVVYLNAADKVVGVEDAEIYWDSAGRPYRMAHPEFSELPVIGKGGPNPVPNLEKIAELNPDVIFVTANPKLADSIQEKTGIPTVVVSYGSFGEFDDEAFIGSITLVGKILDKKERAEEIVKFLKETVRDLERRTEGIPEDKKLRVYVGALSYKGGHGIESTQCDFPPLTVLHAKNVVCEADVKGIIFIDKEKLLEWDPDVIFIDEGNLHLVKADFEKNKEFYMSLKAFREGRIYGILPFNFYWTNVEIALADAYFIGKVLYPEKFADIDVEKKADEIIEFFVGKKLYGELAERYGGFKNLAEEFR